MSLDYIIAADSFPGAMEFCIFFFVFFLELWNTKTKQRFCLLKDTALFLEAGSSIKNLILLIWNTLCADTSQCCTSSEKKSNSIKSASSVNMTLPGKQKASPPVLLGRYQIPTASSNSKHSAHGQVWIKKKNSEVLLASWHAKPQMKLEDVIWIFGLKQQFESYRQSFGNNPEAETCVTPPWDF